jgi:hypothetical protein
MQSLQDKASEWSGVAAADAFAIDDVNVFEALGGTTQPFVDLSTNFYTRSVPKLSIDLLTVHLIPSLLSDLRFPPFLSDFCPDFVSVVKFDRIGSMRTRKSGSGRYSRGRRRRTRSGTNTSSLCSGWAARPSSPRGEVT